MSENDATAEKSADAVCERDLAAAHADHLGTDAQRHEHRYSAVTKTVFVVADGRIIHEQDLGDRELVDWILFVEAERGWDADPRDRHALDASDAATALFDDIDLEARDR